MTADPGWYPDPSTHGSTMRWWDGRGWTEHATAPAHPAGAAPVGPAPVGPTTDDGVLLAGWWRRVAAALLDYVVVSFAAQVLTIPWGIQLSNRTESLMDQTFDPITSELRPEAPSFGAWVAELRGPLIASLVVTLVVALAYHAIMLRLRGQTLGKMAAGLRVRRVDAAGPLPWSTVARRVGFQFGLLGLIGWCGLGLLDVLWPLWDRRRQSLHDKVAGTVVVRDR